MAIIFGNINGTGGGGGGGGFWKLNGASPGTISVDPGAGATDIDTPAFYDPLLRLVGGTFAGSIPFFGFMYNTAYLVFNGIIKNAGNYIVGMIFQSTPGYFGRFQIRDTPGSIENVSEAANVPNVTTSVLRADGSTTTVLDTAANDKTTVQQSTSAHEINVYSTGVEKFRARVTSAGLKLFVNAGANLVFAIDDNGLIYTNQSEAPTANDTTILNRIPIYDEVGALVGYIPLMVDP